MQYNIQILENKILPNTVQIC